MSSISAQVSVYPLRRESIGPAIRKAVDCFRQHGLDVRVGEMSTLIWGEEQELFHALHDAFQAAVEDGDAVMHVTLSNACPRSSNSQGEGKRVGQ